MLGDNGDMSYQECWECHSKSLGALLDVTMACPFGCDNGVSKNSHRQRLRHMLNLTTLLFFKMPELTFVFLIEYAESRSKGGSILRFFLWLLLWCIVLALLTTIVCPPHSIHSYMHIYMYTLWTDGKAEVGRVREENESAERRSEKRKNQKNENAGMRKG